MKNLKNIIFLLSALGMIALLFLCVILRFENPDQTELRIFLDNWYIAPLAIVFALGLNYSSK